LWSSKRRRVTQATTCEALGAASRSRVQGARRTEARRYLAPAARRSACGRRDRGRGRRHAAGCVAASRGSEQSGAGGSAPGWDAFALLDQAGGVRPGGGLRRGLLDAEARDSEGRDREKAMSDAYRTSIEIEAPPERVFDHFVQPELLVRWMGDF